MVPAPVLLHCDQVVADPAQHGSIGLREEPKDDALLVERTPTTARASARRRRLLLTLAGLGHGNSSSAERIRNAQGGEAKRLPTPQTNTESRCTSV